MTLLDIKQGQGYIAKIESNSFVDGGRSKMQCLCIRMSI